MTAQSEEGCLRAQAVCQVQVHQRLDGITGQVAAANAGIARIEGYLKGESAGRADVRAEGTALRPPVVASGLAIDLKKVILPVIIVVLTFVATRVLDHVFSSAVAKPAAMDKEPKP